ncbi:hypothetical protein G9A89_000213 [Geosiphon pyriformis]|nr:hypothetical protein G9A89_000213 [Geosiphon pyriformis]
MIPLTPWCQMDPSSSGDLSYLYSPYPGMDPNGTWWQVSPKLSKAYKIIWMDDLRDSTVQRLLGYLKLVILGDLEAHGSICLVDYLWVSWRVDYWLCLIVLCLSACVGKKSDGPPSGLLVYRSRLVISVVSGLSLEDLAL